MTLVASGGWEVLASLVRLSRGQVRLNLGLEFSSCCTVVPMGVRGSYFPTVLSC